MVLLIFEIFEIKNAETTRSDDAVECKHLEPVWFDAVYHGRGECDLLRQPHLLQPVPAAATAPPAAARPADRPAGLTAGAVRRQAQVQDNILQRGGARVPGHRAARPHTQLPRMAVPQVLRVPSRDNRAVPERRPPQAASIPFSLEQDCLKDRTLHILTEWAAATNEPAATAGHPVQASGLPEPGLERQVRFPGERAQVGLRGLPGPPPQAHLPQVPSQQLQRIQPDRAHCPELHRVEQSARGGPRPHAGPARLPASAGLCPGEEGEPKRGVLVPRFRGDGPGGGVEAADLGADQGEGRAVGAVR